MKLVNFVNVKSLHGHFQQSGGPQRKIAQKTETVIIIIIINVIICLQRPELLVKQISDFVTDGICWPDIIMTVQEEKKHRRTQWSVDGQSLA